MGSYTILLYGTLTVAYDLYTALSRRIGEAEMSLWIDRLFLVTGLALLVFIVLMLPRTVRSLPGIRGYLRGRGGLPSPHYCSGEALPFLPVCAP